MFCLVMPLILVIKLLGIVVRIPFQYGVMISQLHFENDIFLEELVLDFYGWCVILPMSYDAITQRKRIHSRPRV